MWVLLLEPALKRWRVLHPCPHWALAVRAPGCCPQFHVRARDRSCSHHRGWKAPSSRKHTHLSWIGCRVKEMARGISKKEGGKKAAHELFSSRCLFFSCLPSSPLRQISLISGYFFLENVYTEWNPTILLPEAWLPLNIILSLSRSISTTFPVRLFAITITL